MWEGHEDLSGTCGAKGARAMDLWRNVGYKGMIECYGPGEAQGEQNVECNMWYTQE